MIIPQKSIDKILFWIYNNKQQKLLKTTQEGYINMSKSRYYFGLILGIIISVAFIILESKLSLFKIDDTMTTILIGLLVGACTAELIWWHTFPGGILRFFWENAGRPLCACLSSTSNSLFLMILRFIFIPINFALLVIGLGIFLVFTVICFPFQIFTLHAKAY